MGRLKQAKAEVDLPFELTVPADRLDALIAQQEAGDCYYGESLYPPSKRRRQAEPSFLLYTTQQFLEHTGGRGLAAVASCQLCGVAVPIASKSGLHVLRAAHAQYLSVGQNTMLLCCTL
jgi:hypothetical protein